MANATVSNLGQAAGAGSTTALFLKIFAGEVLTAFEDAQTTLDKHVVRSISSGQSAQFPVTGKATAEYHTAGAEITGTAITHNERVIPIQGLLIAPTFIAKIDEAKNHYDVRSIYSKECGNSLAQVMDKHVYQQLINASNSAAADPQVVGADITDADFETSGASAAATIFKAAQMMDERNIPENDRYIAVSPAAYYQLAQTTNVINRDWGGKGAYAEGEVLKVAGVHIVKTNNLPSGSNITSGVLDGSDGTLGGDYTNSVAVAWHKSAVGTVKLLDLSVEMEYDVRRQGTLLVAKYAMGHGVLRPDAAFEIKTS